MLVYSEHHKDFIIDPHLMVLLPFKAIWDRDTSKKKENAYARILYLYHMFHPKSPFWEYKKSTKSMYVVQSIFPKDQQAEPLKWEPYAESFEASFMDEEQWEALRFYVDRYLKMDPLWYSVESYNMAIYNLGDIVRDPLRSASEIRTASNELDELPKRRQKMQQQAESKQAFIIKVAGDKKIRRSERLPSESKRQGQTTTSHGI